MDLVLDDSIWIPHRLLRQFSRDKRNPFEMNLVTQYYGRNIGIIIHRIVSYS
jgi:hypothetical protein